ncbi:TraB/TrbI/VirB10 family type IV secretion system protein [Terriglobus aquaticus]|uniref:TrbI/VirB10 family protein n=1 Tax=Terriglobus aquaticus TaxID=940139 RepID=A0ABW9KLF5_9BACT|nr:hypothetical protein [Terriglobus aquaticus]
MSKLPLAAVLLAATPLLAQQTGVSHPPDSAVEDSAPVTSAPVRVVDAPVLVVPSAAAPVPARPAYTPAAPVDESPSVSLQRRDLARFDPDGKVVGDDVVVNPNAVAAGTMLRARLETEIQTATTQPGSPFRAQITEPLMHEGRVVVPAGAVLEGRVTDIRGGRRLHGPALIHLQAQTIVLPDGSRMPIRASVIDTDKFADTRIDSEGNIVRKDHATQTLAEFSLAAGSTAAAGGLIAGVPGALVGAGIGAGVGTVMWLKADRQTQLPPDTLLVLALDTPLPIQPLVREPEYSVQPLAPAGTPAAKPTAPVEAEPQAFVPTS